LNNWKIEPVDPKTVRQMQDSLHISELLASVLIRRGIVDPEQARYFLHADRKDMQPPEQIRDLTAAVNRLVEAIAKGQKIMVYGDYDVDGVCGTVILLECLRALGAKAEYYIPDRFAEGYGLNYAAIEQLAKQGVQLLVTVDCGINSIGEVARANELGMEVIITDHHTPESFLPKAAAIVNPRLGTLDHCKDLCGAGVVFKLVQKLGHQNIPVARIDEWLELAALATVADIVPLRGENRILVKEGLASMKRTQRLGLKALLQDSKIIGQDLHAYHLGFILAPRINAAGRLKSAALAVDLLMSQEESHAVSLARELSFLNEERKRIEQTVVEEAAASIENSEENLEQGIIMVDGESWHPGVIGIAASRLVDKYRLPVVLVSWQGDLGRGSARSIPGFNLYEALYACRNHLEQFGGHAMAAGLALNRTQMESFRKQLQGQAIIAQTAADSTTYLDGELFSHQLSTDIVLELEHLQPFGEGNPVPQFLIHHDIIERPVLMGANRNHFKAVVQPGNMTMISFRRAEWIDYPLGECRFNLLGNLEINSFRGQTSVQIRATHLQPAYKKHIVGKDAHLESILHWAIERLRQGQPAVFTFPTYRILRYYQELFSPMLQPDRLYSLHGHLASEQQTIANAALKTGRPAIYLVTEPYWHYLYKLNNNQSINPSWVVNFWSSISSSGCTDGENYYPSPDNYPQIRLMPSTDHSTFSALFYINSDESKNKLAQQRSSSAEAMAVSDWSFRLPGYEEDQAPGKNQPGLTPIKSYEKEVNQVVLLDSPYSEYEAFIIARQLGSGSDSCLLIAEFDLAQLITRGDNLRQIYPDRSIVAKMATWLGQRAANGEIISAELDDLATGVSMSADSSISTLQVTNALRIMSDLGLCRYRKKGSIIEIKALGPTTTTLDLADSAFYREGQAEKRAFASWQSWVKEQLAW
jgi:single-stranded-DNA-specific exonuclease